MIQVVIEDTEDKTKYEFMCDKWLADDEDDNLIVRDLECTKGKTTIKSHNRFKFISTSHNSMCFS